MNTLPIEMFDRPRARRTALMQDKLLDLLRAQWVTPIDALEKAQCFSLSQRCGGFKRLGYPIQDKWVHLGSGKKVKAYTLAGRVEEEGAPV